MRLTCYFTGETAPDISPAPLERDWMEAAPFTYRCLPLNIANTHGWVIRNQAPFTATWDGGEGIDSVSIESAGGRAERVLAVSHFGAGVLTFHIDAVFRTEPDYDLWVGGPTNGVKDGVQPLTGIVETDWSVASFTMNWRFTRPGASVAFERREPFCLVFPMPRNLVATCEPEMIAIDAAPEVQSAFKKWADGRAAFNHRIASVPPGELRDRWQKDYFVGGGELLPTAPPSHRTKLRVRPFRKT